MDYENSDPTFSSLNEVAILVECVPKQTKDKPLVWPVSPKKPKRALTVAEKLAQQRRKRVRATIQTTKAKAEDWEVIDLSKQKFELPCVPMGQEFLTLDFRRHAKLVDILLR